jgi:hypothetical protein
MFFSPRRDAEHENRPAAERAGIALSELRGGMAPRDVEARWGDAQVSTLPDSLLPKAKIRDYVGPTVLQALDSLEVGSWSEPIETGGGFHLARVLEREAPIVPPYDEVEPLVRQDLKRRRGDELLRRYLDDLRNQSVVVIDESLFDVKEESP